MKRVKIKRPVYENVFDHTNTGNAAIRLKSGQYKTNKDCEGSIVSEFTRSRNKPDMQNENKIKWRGPGSIHY